MASYIYESLPDPSQGIRLVHLLPGSNGSPIRLKLQAVSFPSPKKSPKLSPSPPPSDKNGHIPKPWIGYENLEGKMIYFNDETHKTSWRHPNTLTRLREMSTSDEPEMSEPQYEALSYTWGSSDNPGSAIIQDRPDLPESTLSIQRNLAEALSALRYPDKIRTMWIDAVCINQGDMTERSQQVERMADIYRLASRVVVWLSPIDSSASIVLPILNHIGRQIEYSKSNHLLPSPEATEPDWFRVECPLPYGDDIYAAVYELLGRPWFERVWIVQEIQLANIDSSLQCGAAVISWPIFRRAVLCLQSKIRMPLERLRPRLMEVRNLSDYALELNLSRLVRRHRDRKCKDPRDKIYGLLSLLTPAFASQIHIDYKKMVSEVYKDAFIAHCHITKRLELFNDCQFNASQLDWPSWLPDWYSAIPTAVPTRLMFASGVSPCEVAFEANNVLRAEGVKCATVNKVGAVASTSQDIDSLRTIREWAAAYVDSSPYVTGQNKLEAFASVICGYRLRERYPKLITLPSIQQWAGTLRDEILDQQHDQTQVLELPYVRDAIGFSKHKTFVSSDEGYFGLAPSETKEGDVICVLLGTNVPLLLRPVSADQFRLAGECCIHGLQDGTGVLGPLPPGWSVQAHFDPSGQAKYSYYNCQSGVSSENDPRLPPLPGHVQKQELLRTTDDPIVAESFEDYLTGNKMKHDPRMTADALRDRGCNIVSFHII
ncbi:heterokaryon incompatibility protein [Fusarium heterosporum]|uniref:Heterokaryon incompatibility protein n=1 Tax=Fusarium heterosporum TaxID=42747 RepID=A0A8H5X506_FUSHE|nr:heterokaryon incompatibility protein [Fusarium heterosporum]